MNLVFYIFLLCTKKIFFISFNFGFIVKFSWTLANVSLSQVEEGQGDLAPQKNR